MINFSSFRSYWIRSLMNLILPYFSVFCYQPCSPLVLLLSPHATALYARPLPPYRPRSYPLIAQPRWTEAAQEFHLRWGQKEKENNSQNTNHTKHSLHIHCTAAWLQFFPTALPCSDSRPPHAAHRSREGEFGQSPLPLFKGKMSFSYIVKGW